MAVEKLLIGATLAIALVSGIEIQCTYEVKAWTVESIHLYTCRGTIISTENPRVITSVSGVHLRGREDSDVKGILIHENRILSTVPRSLENFFANIEAFQWQSGILSSIDASIFEPFRNMIFIHLGYNQLVTLESNLFQQNRNLREIRLARNVLEHVGHNLLSGLPNLTLADFSGNHCTGLFATNRQQVLEINLQLPNECPPSTTSPPTATPTAPPTTEDIDCPEETIRLRRRIAELETRNWELASNLRSCQAHE